MQTQGKTCLNTRQFYAKYNVHLHFIFNNNTLTVLCLTTFDIYFIIFDVCFSLKRINLTGIEIFSESSFSITKLHPAISSYLQLPPAISRSDKFSISPTGHWNCWLWNNLGLCCKRIVDSIKSILNLKQKLCWSVQWNKCHLIDRTNHRSVHLDYLTLWSSFIEVVLCG